MDGTIHDPMKPRAVPYSLARTLIQEGDIGLCRPSGSIIGKAIEQFDRDLGLPEYTHATMFGYAGTCLMIGETLEGRGGRIIAASAEVQRYPGVYDVFRPKCWEKSEGTELDRAAAWGFVCRASGAKYGVRFLPRAWIRRRLPWMQHIVRPIPNSDDPQYPRDCSALQHAALRIGDGPQVREYDADVVPADLTNPSVFSYLMTLVIIDPEIEVLRTPQLKAA
jgi:hypothetical protein